VGAGPRLDRRVGGQLRRRDQRLGHGPVGRGELGDYATTYGWGPDFAAVNNGGIGWVLEVDPMDPDWTPRKHTNLGRLRHENATVWARQGKHLVVHTGDDARDKFLYRYVSSEPLPSVVAIRRA
jgi:uncharacterized protein